MSSTHLGHSLYCASCREHKASGPVGWIQHPFVLKLVGILFFPFCLHHLQLEVTSVLSCLSKNFQRSCNQRGLNVSFQPHFLNRGGYLMQVQVIESDILHETSIIYHIRQQKGTGSDKQILNRLFNDTHLIYRTAPLFDFKRKLLPDECKNHKFV